MALVDTGCATSVLAERLLIRLRLLPQPLKSGDPNFLFGANGSRIRIIGKIMISVKLNGLTVPFDFLVSENLTHDLILGHDFLKETRALINYSDSSITFFENLVEMKIMNRRPDIIASLIYACDLPPRTETIVNVKLNKKLNGRNYLLEPLPMRENQKFLVAKILTNIKNGRTICRMLNATNQVIHLKNKIPLATVHPATPSTSPDSDNLI